jgi:hypothetical protein
LCFTIERHNSRDDFAEHSGSFKELVVSVLNLCCLDWPHKKSIVNDVFSFMFSIYMHDTLMFVELSNNVFSLFINNVFQYYKIILEYFSSHVHGY